MIQKFLVVLALAIMPAAALAGDDFTNSTNDLAEIFKHNVFQRFTGFTIGQIRQGEIGQSQAYFVRLVKPHATVEKGVCIDLVNLGSWQVKSHPYACEE